MMSAEQIVAAHTTQLTRLHDMNAKALATAEKIDELNMQVSRQTVDEHVGNFHELHGTKDVRELVKLNQGTHATHGGKGCQLGVASEFGI